VTRCRFPEGTIRLLRRDRRGAIASERRGRDTSRTANWVLGRGRARGMREARGRSHQPARVGDDRSRARLQQFSSPGTVVPEDAGAASIVMRNVSKVVAAANGTQIIHFPAATITGGGFGLAFCFGRPATVERAGGGERSECPPSAGVVVGRRGIGTVQPRPWIRRLRRRNGPRRGPVRGALHSERTSRCWSMSRTSGANGLEVPRRWGHEL